MSRPWFVIPSLERTVRINEVMAYNVSERTTGAPTPDRIELFNPGAATVDLVGYSLSDRPDAPGKYVFPAGTSIASGDYLVIDAFDGPSLTLNTGFGLDRTGDALYLFSPDRTLLDQVEFGIQIAAHSLGRIADTNEWTLNEPTFGAPNETVPLGNPSQLRINEWYATGDIRLTDDHVEIYNPLDVAVALDGVSISDEPFFVPQASSLPALSFIAPRGFTDLIADGDVQAGADHLSFRLSPTHEHLGLFDANGDWIDQVFYYGQMADVAQGRLPDGAAEYAFRAMPTLGDSNGGAVINTIQIVDMDLDAVWRYNATGEDLQTDWRMPGYDDSQWESGAGLLGFEREHERPLLPDAMRTIFDLGQATYYFRTTVDLPVDTPLSDITANISAAVDDGFVAYLNGQEVLRQGMPDGAINFETLASRNVNEAQLEGPFAVPNQHWIHGQNVIAVEVHQRTVDSGDIVFGLALDATIPVYDHAGGQQRTAVRIAPHLRSHVCSVFWRRGVRRVTQHE